MVHLLTIGLLMSFGLLCRAQPVPDKAAAVTIPSGWNRVTAGGFCGQNPQRTDCLALTERNKDREIILVETKTPLKAAWDIARFKGQVTFLEGEVDGRNVGPEDWQKVLSSGRVDNPLPDHTGEIFLLVRTANGKFWDFAAFKSQTGLMIISTEAADPNKMAANLRRYLSVALLDDLRKVTGQIRTK